MCARWQSWLAVAIVWRHRPSVLPMHVQRLYHREAAGASATRVRQQTLRRAQQRVEAKIAKADREIAERMAARRAESALHHRKLDL